MKTLEKVVYLIGIACAFAYGLVMPLLTPKNAYTEIAAMLGNSRFVAAMVVVACPILSAMIMYFMVRAARNQPTAILFLIKLFILALPAVAVGIVVSVILVALGVCEIVQPIAFLCVSAMSYLCGGVAGIVAMNSI